MQGFRFRTVVLDANERLTDHVSAVCAHIVHYPFAHISVCHSAFVIDACLFNLLEEVAFGEDTLDAEEEQLNVVLQSPGGEV